MNIGVIPVKKFQVVIVDDFYTQEEYDCILNECLFLCDKRKLESPEKTGTAKTPKGEILKSNHGLFLDHVYSNRNISDILFYNRKMFYKEFMEQLVNIDIVYRYVQTSKLDITLLSYYENTHYYKPHYDTSKITVVSWFYIQPKSFLGGELIIENEWKIDCLANRTVIFPSMFYHEVSEIKMKEEDLNRKKGRFTISMFID